MCWSSKYPPIKRNAQNHIIVYKVVVYISHQDVVHLSCGLIIFINMNI